MSAVKSEAMNQRFHLAGQYCTELQEQLSEANNKISRAVLVCLFFSLQLHFYSFCPNDLQPSSGKSDLIYPSVDTGEGTEKPEMENDRV